MEPQAQATEQAGPPPQAIMMQMSMGAMVTQAIFVAAKLRIADIVADGEKHIDEIATEAEAHSPSLYRILRTLAPLGVFNEPSLGRSRIRHSPRCFVPICPDRCEIR